MERYCCCPRQEPGVLCSKCGGNRRSAFTRLLHPASDFRPGPEDGGRFPPPPSGHLDAAPVGLLESRVRRIGHGVITAKACEMLLPSDERMVWEEAPSAWAVAPLGARYAVALLAAASVLDAPAPILILVSLAAALHIAARYIELRNTIYRLSSQRLEVTSGIWSRKTVTYEVHKLSEASITSSPLLRNAGRSNLIIQSPGITLWGIRSANTVRDLLREAGEIEGGRVDRLRWR